MARINFITQGAFGIRYQHPNERPGTPTIIPTYRLAISVYVVPRGGLDRRPRGGIEHLRRFVAVLDTGAPLTVIPFHIWREFADDVDILAQPSAESQLEIGGGSQNGQLGRFRLGAVDDDGHWMPADWTVAQFLDESSALQVPLLGLNAHFFAHHRRVRHVGFSEGDGLAAVPEWCLEDRSRLTPW